MSDPLTADEIEETQPMPDTTFIKTETEEEEDIDDEDADDDEDEDED